ncbi:MAG: methyltransferase domain-containing protein [Erysipelotrichaceae bacterium]
MYNKLADVYDLLVKDDQATLDWCNYIEAHSQASKILEVACGSGEITLELARRGKHVDASDLSAEMLERAKAKAGSEQVNFSCMDLRDLAVTNEYDTVLCLCDSLNYILETEEIQRFFQAAYDALRSNGTLIFDVHSMDRIAEFADEFYEEGHLGGYDYEWSILSDRELIYQNFIFFDEQAHAVHEQHIQRVYEPALLQAMLEAIGFSVSIDTDFVHKGIQEGEKYFFVCKKEN